MKLMFLTTVIVVVACAIIQSSGASPTNPNGSSGVFQYANQNNENTGIANTMTNLINAAGNANGQGGVLSSLTGGGQSGGAGILPLDVLNGLGSGGTGMLPLNVLNGLGLGL